MSSVAMFGHPTASFFTALSLCCACGTSTAVLGDDEAATTAGIAGAPASSVTSSTTMSGGAAGTSTASSAAMGGGAAGASALGVSGSTAANNVQSPLPVTAEQLNLATARCGGTPWIFTGLVPNSRGLGGLPLSTGSVSCGKLYRGSQLNAMSSTGCAQLSDLGIRTAIDLRTASEAAMTPAPTCVPEVTHYVAAPMPTPYNLSAQDYISDLHAHASLLAVFRMLGDESAYPVYFHCIYGRDRTGVLAALILRLLGASRAVVMAEYMRTAEAGVGTAPASLEATLDEIDRLGGAEAFLLSIGAAPEWIAVLRAQTTTNVIGST